MSNLEAVLQFGRIAVEHGLLSREQVSEVMMKQMQDPGRSLGEILVADGMLSSAQVEWIQSVQQSGPPRPPAQTASEPSSPVSTQPVAAMPSMAPATPAPAPAVPTPAPAAPAPAPAVPTPAPAAPAPAPTAAAESTVAPAPVSVGSEASGGVTDYLYRLVAQAAERDASDLHLHSGTGIRMRIHGELVEEPNSVASPEVVRSTVEALLSPRDRELFESKGQVDFAHTVPGVARLRCNAYRQRVGPDLIVRIVPAEVPTLASLGMPPGLEKLADYHQGMVLLTGPSGCGKSSTLASLVALINEQRPSHILTIEDPIEYIHPSKGSLVNQRQVNHHTESFSRALRAALREDPDVIVIGELRDLETISLALTAAETGHLVLATMHTMSAIATINRLIGAFPPNEQAQIRTMVSESLRAVVSQRLVKKATGVGRVPALEVLICTTAVSNLVREKKTYQLPSILQSGAALGMCMLDASLAQLVKSGTVSREEALVVCDNPKYIPA